MSFRLYRACCTEFLAGLIAATLSTQVSHAYVTWTGAATPDVNWTTAHNWLSDTPPLNATATGVIFDLNSVNNITAMNNDFANLIVDDILTNDPPGPVTMGGNSFTMNAGINSGTATQDLTIALAANQTITLASGSVQNWSIKAPRTVTISSPLVGDSTSGFKVTTPSGSSSSHGILQLLAPSPNFAGSVEIGGPNMFVVLGANNAFGTNTVTINSFNSAPQLQSSTGGGTRTIANNMNWGSGFGAAGTDNFVLNGNIKFTDNPTHGANRSLTTQTAINITSNGTITMGDPDLNATAANSLTITPLAGSTITLNGVMQDPTGGVNTKEGFFVKSGAGLGVITNTANTYSGSNQVQNGILQVANLANKGTASSLGTGNVNAEIQLGSAANTGTLQYLGAANISTDRPLRLIGTTGGGVLDNSGAGTMTFTSSTFGTTGAGIKTFTLTGSNNGLNTIAGVITNNSGTNTTKLLKNGNGTWMLTGANTYSGTTQIDSGTLLIDNTTGSGTGTGAVTVNNGGLLGGGNGTAGTGVVSGAVTVASGGAVSPGTPGTNSGIGTLTTNSTFTLNGGSVLNYDLGSAGHDLISGITNLSIPNTGTVTINLANVGGLAGGPAFPIIDYSGTLTGTFSTLQLGTQPSGFTYQLQNNTGNTSIDLLVTAAGLAGDFNNDGKVDAGDYLLWRKNNGTNNALPNDNGLGTPIGNGHFNLWRANYGRPPGAGTGFSGPGVPEPASLALAALGVVLLGAGRQRS
jgi:fibronectin-binding autotransporter adhesin